MLHAHRQTASGVAVADAEINANRRRAVALAVAAGLVPGAVAAAIAGGLEGAVAAVVVLVGVTVVIAVGVWQRSTAVVVRLVRARPLSEEDCPRLVNVLENLCATFGLRQPRLMAVDDPVPNACTLGRMPHDAVMLVTTGLLEHLDLVQLEGLVAHELAHVRRHDTVVSGVAVAVLAPMARLTGDCRWLHLALGRGREYRADQVAVAAVRYPPGLRDALSSLAGAPPPASGSVFEGWRLAATRWLWIHPLTSGAGSAERAGLDDVDVRIAALAEL